MKSLLLYCSFVAISLFALTSSGHAATFTVTKTADTNDGVCDADCSLREAIAAANVAASDDEVLFDPNVFGSPQIIILVAGDIRITNNGSLSIFGPGAELLSLDGIVGTRILTLENAPTVVIESLKFVNGNGRGVNVIVNGGAIYNSGGDLTIRSSLFSGNTTNESGGAIYNSGTLLVENTSFSGNLAGVDQSGYGGAIFNSDNASYSVTGSGFSTNQSGADGGAIFGGAGVSGTVNNSNFLSNRGVRGGGIFQGGGKLSVSNSTFVENVCPHNFAAGGGVYIESGIYAITSSTFTGNRAAGGGAVGSQATGSISHSIFMNNSADNGQGGAIGTSSGSLTLSDSLIAGNSASTRTNFDGARGGGISGANITAERITLINNTSTSSGAGVYVSGSVLIRNSLLRNNVSQAAGGGARCEVGVLTIENSTLTENVAATGGGIARINGCILNLNSSTIARNTADVGGGVSNQSTFVGINAANTIIADNISLTTTAANYSPDFIGILTSGGYNLVENTTNTTIAGVTTGNILGRDPQLVPVRDNGGATLTVALQPTSPAIDAANPNDFLTTDQRGVPRPQDGDLNGSSLPDIGAYERQVFPFVVSKTDDTNDGLCDEDCSLREAVGAANGAATPDNAILFNAGLFDSPRTFTLGGNEVSIVGTNTIVIHGPGQDLITISGDRKSRVFAFAPNTNAALIGLSITNGNGLGELNSGLGGGIYAGGNALGIRDVALENNEATVGGGIAVLAGATSMEDTNVIGNSSALGSGSIFVESGSSIAFRSTRIADNLGVGIENRGDGQVLSSTVERNRGGGILNQLGGTISIIDTTVQFNLLLDESQNGGGISNSGVATVRNSTINGNAVAGNASGGGVYNTGTLSLINSTLSGNRAGVGGGIRNLYLLTLSHATVVKNSAFVCCGGGIVSNEGATTTIRNSLIARNVAANNNLNPDLQGVITSQGYNLIGNQEGATIIGTSTGNLVGVEPFIDPMLRMNGGLTKTHALRRQSPAIDKGSSSSPGVVTDQRGRIRPYNFPSIPNAVGGNGSDIGAFERQADDPEPPRVEFDFDGDGRADVGVYRPVGGEWWLLNSGSGNLQYSYTQFGLPTDILTPADFTGDGITDISVFRPEDGVWYVKRSETDSYFGFQFGGPGDIPAPADYDGDGKADAAVFRPSEGLFFIFQSSDLQVRVEQFGTNGDRPVAGDFDGDGKADIALWRETTGEWFVLKSSGGFAAVQFGLPGDKAIPADFTGDGITDIAVWRPSETVWYIVRSENGTYYGFPFGLPTDQPIPADYDGDGQADPAVYRPSEGGWYLMQTTAGLHFVGWGTGQDRPVPGAFVR